MTPRWSVCSAAALLLLLVGCNRQNGSPQGTSPSAPAASVSSEQNPPDFVPVDKQPELVSHASPKYPPEDAAKGAEGMVVVKLVVTTDGSTQKATIARNEGATTSMEKAALEAAEQWKFSPAVKDGKPVAVWVSIPFKFKLADKAEGATGTSLKKDADPKYKEGYIAGRKEALNILERRAEAARRTGKPDAALEKEIEKEKAEVKKLEK